MATNRKGTRVFKRLWCLLGAALPALCQCPALTGGGNIDPQSTISVWGVADPNLGMPPLDTIAQALSNWAAMQNTGITVQVYTGAGVPAGPNVEAVYAHLGAEGHTYASTSWTGTGGSTMKINIDWPIPAGLGIWLPPNVWRHPGAHPPRSPRPEFPAIRATSAAARLASPSGRPTWTLRGSAERCMFEA